MHLLKYLIKTTDSPLLPCFTYRTSSILYTCRQIAYSYHKLSLSVLSTVNKSFQQ